MKTLIAGNWKMNGDLASAQALASGIASGLVETPDLFDRCDFLVCPPYLHLSAVREKLDGAGIALGGQDNSPFENGAYTGDISAAMIKDMGCSHVILGHSERRSYYAESNLMIKQKAAMAYESGLVAVICVGESAEEREAGKAEEIVGGQLTGSLPETATAENTVIAYEPVWAIGTGKVATIEDITTMHDFMRGALVKTIDYAENIPLLYGGSVKPGNAREIFAVENVNGALIGGAALSANDFLGIAEGAHDC